MKETAEKRRNKRLDCYVPVEGKDGDVFDHAKTVDLSSGGFGFVSFKKIPINKEIMIEIETAQDEMPIIVRGKVCWIHTIEESQFYRIGLTFLEANRGSKTRFAQYMRKLMGRRSVYRHWGNNRT